MSKRRERQLQEIRDTINSTVNARLTAFVKELVPEEDITSWTQSTRIYKGNKYTSYSLAVSAINKKYKGIADWGCLLTGNIIDVRAAFTIPRGLDVIKESGDDVELELAFVKEFMNYNLLDKHIPMEFEKESELDGKILLALIPDPGYEWTADINGKTKKMKGMIKVRFMPWSTYKYIVKTDSNDYLDYTSIEYKEPNTGNPKSYKSPFFVYRMFGGRINDPNNPSMKIWKCLTQIDSLSQALRDWREINNLFAAPILGLQCESKEDVTEAQEGMDNMNLRLRKVLAYYGDLKYIGPSMAGVQSLMDEIITLAKMISGSTGVPVHFLGLPDLMSNRSTAENLMELIWASTVKEREIWNSAYNELLYKAIDIFNSMQEGRTPLKQEMIGIEIINVTSEQWKYLEKVYLPLYQEGAITLDYLLLQIPGLDIEEEKRRREFEEKDELKRVKDEVKDLQEKQVQEEPSFKNDNDIGNLKQQK